MHYKDYSQIRLPSQKQTEADWAGKAFCHVCLFTATILTLLGQKSTSLRLFAPITAFAPHRLGLKNGYSAASYFILFQGAVSMMTLPLPLDTRQIPVSLKYKCHPTYTSMLLEKQDSAKLIQASDPFPSHYPYRRFRPHFQAGRSHPSSLS